MKRYVVLLFISLLPHVSWADGPFCDADAPGNPMPASQIQQIKFVNNKMEPSGFGFACQKEVRSADMPKLTNLKVREGDSDGNTTRTFLLKVAAKASEFLKKNADQTLLMKHCLLTEVDKPQCEGPKEIFALLPKEMKFARAQLSYAQGIDGKGRVEPYMVNAWNGFPHPRPWARYSADEIKDAAEVQRMYQSTIRALLAKPEVAAEVLRERGLGHLSPAAKRSALNGMVSGYMNQKREEHMAQYRELMGNRILLQHLHSENPDQAEIKEGLEGLLKNAAREQARISIAVDKLKSGATIDCDALWLLMYKPLVEEVLLHDPKFCTVGAQVIRSQEQCDARSTGAMTLGLLAASAIIPPLAPVTGAALVGGLSAGVTGFWVSDSYKTYKRTSEVRATTVDDKDAIISQEDVENAGTDVAVNVVLSGVFGGKSMVKAAASTIRGAKKVSKTVLDKTPTLDELRSKYLDAMSKFDKK